MKKLLQKLLLLCTLCLVGGNAWAETKLLYERGIETSWSAADVTAWGANDFAEETGLHKTGGNGSNSATLTINPTENSIIDIEAYWIGMSNTGRTFAQGNCSYFNYAGVWVEENDQDRASAYSINGFSNSNYTTFTSPSGRANRAYDPTAGAWYVIKMQINTATNTLVYLTVEGSDKLGTKLVNISNKTLTNPDYTKVIFGYLKTGGVSTTNNEYLKSIKITETTQTVTTAEYTINYKFEGATIHHVTGVKNIGETVSAESPIVIEGQKYYAVNEATLSLEITGDANQNVLNVELRKANEYPYSVTTSLGETISAGTYTEGEAAINVIWSKYTQKDGEWYETEAPYGISISEEVNKVVNYSSSTIDYFIECENMSKSRSVAAELTGNDYSGGRAPRHYSNSYWWTTTFAEGGLYTLTIPYRNNNSSGTTISIYTRDAEGNLTDTELKMEGTSGSHTFIVENVSVPAGCSLVLYNTNSYNSNLHMDYIVMEKAEFSQSIGTTGYASFSYKKAVNIPEGVTAYTAKVNEAGDAITLTEVGAGAVPANTGLILKGTASQEYTFTVAESATPVEGNDLIATSVAANATIPAEGTFYALSASAAEFRKVKNGLVLPNNKAYIAAPAGTEAALRVIIGEETAINGVEAVNASENAPAYNVAGQRVQKNQKGMVIMNGKKYFNK